MESIADYTGLRRIGSSDEATTSYLAEPPARLGLPGPVVLKVLGMAIELMWRMRVTHELQLLAAVDSPHVIRLLDAGHQDGRVFYALEDLGRGTLAEPAGELNQSGILKVVADTARGAHALHEAGLAHGAISPATVTLHDEGAKLAEIDLARFINPGMTVRRGTAVASIECSDPAVICGEPASRASDIWSLGITLHRAVTGRSAYGEMPPPGGAAVLRVLGTRPVVAEGTHPAVATIVKACLQADSDDRPRTAMAVAELVEDLL